MWSHRPLRGELTITSNLGSDFGGPNTRRPRHNGVDFRTQDFKPPFDDEPRELFSPHAGRVIMADVKGKDDGDGGGLELVIEHDDGTVSGYAHLSVIVVDKGDRVAGGELVALTGNSGTSTTAPHLHMTARAATGARISPLSLIPSLDDAGDLPKPAGNGGLIIVAVGFLLHAAFNAAALAAQAGIL